MFTFDHVAICCQDLEDGAAWVAETLGVTLTDVGYHPAMSTHNRLLSLGGTEYLEVIAIDPAAPPPGRARWFALDSFSGRPRPTNWLVHCANIDAAAARLPGIGTILDLERGPYSWRVSVPDDGNLPYDNLHPGVLQWKGPHPAPQLPASGVTLTRMTVSHPQAPMLERDLAMADPRIAFAEGDPGLSVTFATPNGPRTLA